MLSCNYYYKDKFIGNEMQLNDFLLEKRKFHSKYGDVVFDHNTKFNFVFDRIHQIKLDSKELTKIYNDAKAKAIALDMDELFYTQRPYIGVTEFLSQFRNSENKRLFPEFIEENYWSNRYNDWSQGKFTEDEIEVFFDGDESKVTPIDIGNPNEWRSSNGLLKSDFGTDIQKKYRDEMKSKWKALAEFGNELHGILLKYFSYRPGTDKEMWFTALLKGHVTNDLFEQYLRNEGIITDKTDARKVEQTIKYATDLRAELEDQFGKGSYYFPEFTIFSELNLDFTDKNGFTVANPKLLGRIDLLVIDEKGNVHIVDYKTSPKSYLDYNKAKELGFTYQLLSYERMLRRWGLNTLATKVYVAPLKLNNLKKDNNGVWTYESVERGNNKPDINGLPRVTEDLTYKQGQQNISSNLDEFLTAPLTIEGNSENLISSTTETMTKFFGKYGNPRTRTEEEIKELINDQKGFEVNPNTGQMEYKPDGASRPITAKTEAELIKKITNYYNGQRDAVMRKTLDFKTAILYGQTNDTENISLPPGTSDWVKNTISKYCSDDWELIDTDATNAAMWYGMLFMRNKHTLVVEVVKLSARKLDYLNKFGKNRTTLFGGLEVDDIKENSNSQSLSLKAYNGNIELMEAMVVLNNLDFNKDFVLNKIHVISPFGSADKDHTGIIASNKELLYNYTKLRKLANLTNEDKFNTKTGKIKLSSYVQQCFFEFGNILERITDHPSLKYEKLAEAKAIIAEPALSELFSKQIPTNIEHTLEALGKLSKLLEEYYNMNVDLNKQGESIHSTFESYENQFAKTLYQTIQQAILELKGIDLRQEIKDSRKWLDSGNVLAKGISGLMLDNSKNFNAQLMNKISDLILTSVLDAREMAIRRIRKTRDMTEDLKKKSGFSGILEHTIGNQTSLYKGMTYYDKTTGDLLFINPWEKPSSPLMEYLKYVITEINKDRYPDLTKEQIELKIADYDLDYFRVPLIKASFASKIDTAGWLGWLKNRLKMFMFWKKSSRDLLKDYARNKATEFLTETEENEQQKSVEIFKTVNLMDQGNTPERLDIINENVSKFGEEYYERDLEKILQTHIWSYATKKATDKQMPLIKAAFVSLAVSGNEQNVAFKETMDFYQKYIRNKVLHQSIIEEKYRTAKGFADMIQQASSWMALAFAPVQSYQMIEGIWKDAKLIITKPDGTQAFTAQNMKDAFSTVYEELFNGSDNNTVCRGINAFYGINDMDARSFAENNSSNNHGIFNFMSKLAFKLVSRPDFYNRMTIFVSQMKHDGSYDAHYIKDNQLEYDWTKDKRFAAYAKGDKSDMEAYTKAKAAYFAVAEQLVREGAVDKDGKTFTMSENDEEPTALPKAYSNLESESMKAIGDIMYGYYDSTKTSLFHSTLLGGLLGQMKKYWSSKKNQYAAPGGHKAQGRWEQMKDPAGNKMFYAKTDDGQIDRNAPLVTEDDPKCSKLPFMQWTGRWEEGVISTLYDVISTSVQDGVNPRTAWNNKLNNADEEVAKLYRSNMRLFLADLLMWLLLGSLATMYMTSAKKDAVLAKKTGHLEDAAYATFTGLTARMFKNSTLDFNWIKAIFETSVEWDPFALNYLRKEAKVLGNLMTGDASFTDTITKSFSATRQIKPMIDYITRDEG